MSWLVLASILLTLVIPLAVGVIESLTALRRPDDRAFFQLAQALGGDCHARWGRERTPVVRISLPSGEARVVVRRARKRWALEARAYLEHPFGFAARISLPPKPPLRWRAPGLAPADFAGTFDRASIESTDERLASWLVAQGALRDQLVSLHEELGDVTATLTGDLVILQVFGPRGASAEETAVTLGPAVAQCLKVFATDLRDLAGARRDAGELPVGMCAACGQALSVDPWVCPACGRPLHRGCREMVGGCSASSCSAAPDAAPGLIRRESPAC